MALRSYHFRLVARVIQRLDELAAKHHTNRSRLLRLALAYAVFEAPEKWLPRKRRQHIRGAGLHKPPRSVS